MTLFALVGGIDATPAAAAAGEERG